MGEKRFFNKIMNAVRGKDSIQPDDGFSARISNINKLMDDAEKNSRNRVHESYSGVETLRKDIEELKKKMNQQPVSGVEDLRKEMSGVSSDVMNKINAINSKFDATGLNEIKNEIESLRKDVENAKKGIVPNGNGSGKNDAHLKRLEDDLALANLRINELAPLKELNGIKKEVNDISVDVTNKIGAINSRIDGMPDGEAMDEVKTAVESLIKDVESAKKRMDAVDGAKDKTRKVMERIDSISAQISKMQTGKEIESLKKELNTALDSRIESLRKEMNGVSADVVNKINVINSRFDAMGLGEIKNEIESLRKDAESAKAEKRVPADEWNEATAKFQKSVDAMNSRLGGMMTAKDRDELRKEIEVLKKGIEDARKEVVYGLERVSLEFAKNVESVKARVEAMPKADADILRMDVEALKNGTDQKLKQIEDEIRVITKNTGGTNSVRPKTDETPVWKKAQDNLVKGGDRTDALKRVHEAHEDNDGHKAEMIMTVKTGAGFPVSKANEGTNDEIGRLKKRYEQIEGKVKADKLAGRDVSHEEMLLGNASFELTVAELCLLEGDAGPCRQRMEKAGEMLEKVN